MPVSILIVDDHEVVREGVRMIIGRARPQWEICGEADNGKRAIDAAAQLKPDIVLLDITMPGLSGLDAAARISEQVSELGLPTKILIFTMHQSEELADDARRVGAKGYVTKSDAARHLVTAIETLLAGGTFFGGPEKKDSNPQKGPAPGLIFRLGLAFCWG